MGKIPPTVAEAIEHGDKATLSRMGRAGARARKRIAIHEDFLRQYHAEKLAEEFRKMREEANEHVCPLD